MHLFSVVGVFFAIGLAILLSLAAFANSGVLLLPWPFSAEVATAPLPWALLGFATGGVLLALFLLIPPLLTMQKQQKKLSADLAEREQQLLALLAFKFSQEDTENKA